MRTIVYKLSEARLYLDINKSKFAIKKVKYLRLILITNSFKIDPSKIKTILD